MLKAVSGAGSSFAGGVNGVVQALFTLTGANMTLTSDQPFTKNFSSAQGLWVPLAITVAWASGAFGTACAGGIYTGATKTGTAIVAAAQSYAALTGSGTGVNAAIAASGPFTATPNLSLTTGNTGALTANLTIFGVVVG